VELFGHFLYFCKKHFMVGKKLRILRTKAQISQQDLADFVGVDRKTYINWENEITDIKSEYIPRLAEKLGVDFNELFDENVTSIQQTFTDSIFNNSIMIMMVTDKKVMTDVLKVLKRDNNPE